MVSSVGYNRSAIGAALSVAASIFTITLRLEMIFER